MSYEPTNWKDGDLVTSAKLNKLEQGVAAGGGITFVEMDEETLTLNKTWQEIYDAIQSGMVYLKITRDETNESDTSQYEELDTSSHNGGTSTMIYPLAGFYQNDNDYWVNFGNDMPPLQTTSSNGYPSFNGSNGSDFGVITHPVGDI